MVSSLPLNFASDTVDRHAREPARVALRWVEKGGPGIEVTFRELSLRSNKAANVLRNLGVTPGARVLILLPLDLAWWESILGVMKTGGVAVLGEDAASHQVIANQINVPDAAALIAHVAVAPRMEEVLSACPGLRRRIVVGWEREGWTDYDRRVSLASSEFDPVETRRDDPCLMLFSDASCSTVTTYTHGSTRFDLDLLDAWRTGDTLIVRPESSGP